MCGLTCQQRRVRRISGSLGLALFVLFSLSPHASGQTYEWVGTDANWNNANNWATGTEIPPDYEVPPMNQNTELYFGSRPGQVVSMSNDLGDWRDVGRIFFSEVAPSFTMNGNAIGFRPYQGTGRQVIEQRSGNTQTINLSAMSFRSDVDSELVLWGGDLVINTPNLYIDMNADAWRTLYIKGFGDGSRRTVTFAGNVNRGGTGRDPDIVIQDNKRALVTGALNTGQGTDASVFIENGVLQFSGSGTMNGGAPLLGASSGSASAAVLLDTAGATLTNQIEVRGGSSGRRTIGALNTSGTATFSGNITENNSPGDLDLAAATGGTANFSGSRNLNAGLRINRADGGTSYGGTVQLSGTTTSTSWTALYNGALQFSNFSQLGSSHIEFDASSGDSGTLLYTGGTATTAKTLWIDNGGITRAAINVSNADTTLTWNPSEGNRNQNLTKTGAGALVFGGAISGGTVRVEAGKLVLNGTNTYTGGTTVSGGRLVGTTAGLQGAIANNAEVEFAQENSGNYSSVISGSGSVLKSGSGNVTLTGTNTYTGGTQIAAGGLIVNGSIASSAVTVQSGGFLGGSGTVGSITVESGGTVAPGNSPGTLNINGDINWLGGGSYNWQIVAATGAAGTGWDLQVATGELDLTALSSGNQFNINLWSLSSTSPADVSGALGDFNANQGYTWTLVTASNGITGFSADKFAINLLATNGTDGFANALAPGWGFSVSTNGNNLNLVYAQQIGPAPVPEPGTWAAAGLLVLAAAYMRWRRRMTITA